MAGKAGFMKGIAHVCIGSRDLKQTEDFYCGALGMKRKFVFRKGEEVVGIYLDAGNRTFIEAFRQDQIDECKSPVIGHICLEVSDIDKSMAHLKEKGVKVGEKSMGCDNSWQAWLADPSGVRIELHQYTAKSTQLTGKDCIVNW